MQPTIDIDKRYRTQLVLWFAMIATIGVFLMFAWFLRRRGTDMVEATNSVFVITLFVIALLVVVASFAVKQKLLRQSFDRQDLGMVQSAQIVACALCEAAALMGVVVALVTGYDKFYLFMIIAAVGDLLHFPRREHLLAASFRSSHTV